MLAEVTPGESRVLVVVGGRGLCPSREERVEQLQADSKTHRWEFTGVIQEEYGCLSCWSRMDEWMDEERQEGRAWDGERGQVRKKHGL